MLPLQGLKTLNQMTPLSVASESETRMSVIFAVTGVRNLQITKVEYPPKVCFTYQI